jgi:hypothetical protein
MEEINCILQKTTTHGSDVAKYLLLMLKVLFKDGFSMDEVFPIFKDLFDHHQLSNCKRGIMNVEGSPY